VVVLAADLMSVEDSLSIPYIVSEDNMWPRVTLGKPMWEARSVRRPEGEFGKLISAGRRTESASHIG
jgi:hypothetical protein